MKRLPLVLMFLALLCVSALAQTRQITVLADFSDRSQFEVENRLFEALDKLGKSGKLNGLNIDSSPLVINTGQADGKALLKSWNLSETELPMLAITNVTTEGSHPNLLWHWKVDSLPSALSALEAELGLASSTALPIIRAADYTPKDGPLAAGRSITITVQGSENCSATFDIGGVTGTPLFELESGLYRGEYVVKADDRTDAAITVRLTTDSGATADRLLGHILLQGVQAPQLQSARQISTGEWLLTGTAPPNSQVSVTAVVKQTFIFKFTSTTHFKGTADASGQFQLTSYIDDNVGGSEATFTTTATLNQTTQASEQKMVFQGLPQRYAPPSNGSQNFSPWSLAGQWYHGKQATSIRVDGANSVVIRNEFGQKTVLYLVGRDRLESRSSDRLTGRVNGSTILWDNGTRWDRSRF